MIRINQLKLPITHSLEDLEIKIRKTLFLKGNQDFTYEIIRQSIDARKKNDKKYVYSIHVKVQGEKSILKKVSDKNIMSINPVEYTFPKPGTTPLEHPPVIVGSGPAGLFAGYMLAKAGYKPVILERGASLSERQANVEEFWRTGILNTESNVQFGEGGAGTFSDGKLNTLVKDAMGRNRVVLEIFVECGAPSEILYQQKPHLGTDALMTIVANMRQKIEEMGGTFHFHTKVTDISVTEGHIKGVICNEHRELPSEAVILAVGHSARDTFQMLSHHNMELKQKSFAVGVRVEHPQEVINQALYGENHNKLLGAAPYKVTHTCENGRGVYSFCMCPGGYVVNASSCEGRLCVNGMSYQDRGSRNANSAIIVSVSPKDYASDDPLAGVRYQQELEKAAYKAAKGKIPLQRLEDFQKNQPTTVLGTVKPEMKGAWSFANVRQILPEYVGAGIIEGMKAFGKKIKGFDHDDTLISGVESRTSSPVRMVRSDMMESNIQGLYPCGEGAGYAGGITSAAMDGVKAAEAIAQKFIPFKHPLA